MLYMIIINNEHYGFKVVAFHHEGDQESAETYASEKFKCYFGRDRPEDPLKWGRPLARVVDSDEHFVDYQFSE